MQSYARLPAAQMAFLAIVLPDCLYDARRFSQTQTVLYLDLLDLITSYQSRLEMSLNQSVEIRQSRFFLSGAHATTDSEQVAGQLLHVEQTAQRCLRSRTPSALKSGWILAACVGRLSLIL